MACDTEINNVWITQLMSDKFLTSSLERFIGEIALKNDRNLQIMVL